MEQLQLPPIAYSTYALTYVVCVYDAMRYSAIVDPTIGQFSIALELLLLDAVLARHSQVPYVLGRLSSYN
jgi:hypothetical protein